MAGIEVGTENIHQRSSFSAKAPADGAAPLRTLVVIEFAGTVPPEAVKWLVEKIISSRKSGGAELNVQQTTDSYKKVPTLHVSATTDRLLLGAELMELRKPHKDGSLYKVSHDHLKKFPDTENQDNFLTMSEKQRIILHELESIRALEGDTSVPGLKCELYTDEAIVPKCIHDDIIMQMFPLHDSSDLETLERDWYMAPFKTQPIEKIQRYFGDTLAMYFSFLGFYTMALVPPTVLGLFTKFFVTSTSDMDPAISFSVFNLVWATLFLEAWKRKSATLAYGWGTIKSEPFEEARAACHGELGINKVTNRLEPKYPKWKRRMKLYGVSVPVVLLCLFGAFQAMLYYFYWESVALAYDREYKAWWTGYMTFVPSIAYAVVIFTLNALYRWLAKALNDWENHRLQSVYEKRLITKLVLFDFMNCFMSLFYIAFYLRDMKMLRMNLATLMIVSQLIQQCQETLIPYLIYKYRKNGDDRELAEIEGTKDVYLGTLDDYLELFLQFGYVFLFSAVYPTAAFWALLNNVMEVRTDAFKMCRVFQRPFARPTAGIGAWQIAFEMMSMIAVMTNCALIALSPYVEVWLPDRSEVDILLFFIVAEHTILFLKLAIAYVIPSEPEWIQVAIQRIEYQAWRKQI